MEQKLNIAEILKDKPVELKLYSSTFGYIKFNGVYKDKIYFYSEDSNAHSVKPDGKMYDGGEYSFTFKPYVGYKVELIGFFIEMFKDEHDMLKYKYFQIFLENKNIYGCFYVHQLQHLLFGLGLNHEIEV